MKPFVITFCSLFVLTNCAKTPSSIMAVPVLSSEYSHLSCFELNNEQAVTATSLGQAEEKQRNKVATDVVTVWLNFVAISALVGDEETIILQEKRQNQRNQQSKTTKNMPDINA